MKDINTMTEEEINIEIAKFMGLDVRLFKSEHMGKMTEAYLLYEKLEKSGIDLPMGPLPDYCNNLNLVYEVEEKLYKYLDESINKSRGNYLIKLESLMRYGFPLTDIIHASALNRCKAIILTIKE